MTNTISLFQSVMLALEQTARDQYVNLGMSTTSIKADDQALRYGPYTRGIVRAAGAPITFAQVRRVLNERAEQGQVLRYQSRDRGQIRWWPVGLIATLKQERAAAASGAAA